MKTPAYRAFTLIEVTLALAIFALAVVGLTQAFVNILMSLDSIDNEASLQADLQFLRSHIILEPDLEKLKEGGEINTLGSGSAHWQAEVEPMPVSDLFRVILTIELSEPQDANPVTITEEILLLRPTWSDPVERSTILAENADRLQAERLNRDWP